MAILYSRWLHLVLARDPQQCHSAQLNAYSLAAVGDVLHKMLPSELCVYNKSAYTALYSTYRSVARLLDRFLVGRSCLGPAHLRMENAAVRLRKIFARS